MFVHYIMEQMRVGLLPRNHYGFLLERLYYRTIISLHDFRKEELKGGGKSNQGDNIFHLGADYMTHLIGRIPKYLEKQLIVFGCPAGRKCSYLEIEMDWFVYQQASILA